MIHIYALNVAAMYCPYIWWHIWHKSSISMSYISLLWGAYRNYFFLLNVFKMVCNMYKCNENVCIWSDIYYIYVTLATFMTQNYAQPCDETVIYEIQSDIQQLINHTCTSPIYLLLNQLLVPTIAYTNHFRNILYRIDVNTPSNRGKINDGRWMGAKCI